MSTTNNPPEDWAMRAADLSRYAAIARGVIGKFQYAGAHDILLHEDDRSRLTHFICEAIAHECSTLAAIISKHAPDATAISESEVMTTATPTRLHVHQMHQQNDGAVNTGAAQSEQNTQQSSASSPDRQPITQAPDSAPMRGETPSTTMKLKQVAHLEPKLALIEMVGHGNTLERELNEAIEGLREVEWENKDDEGRQWCPSCQRSKMNGHLNGCRLSAILQKHQSEKRPSNEIT